MVINEIILKNPLFYNMEKEDITHILKCLGGVKKTFGKGEFIFLAGQSEPEVSILLDGKAQVVRESYWGDVMLIGVLEPGDIFAETYACMGAKVIPVSVVAVENSEVLMLDLNRVIRTCNNSCAFHHRLIFNLLKVVANKTAHLNKKMSYLTHKTIRGRLAAYFLDCAEQALQNDYNYFENKKQNPGKIEFTIPLSRTELADFLCVDRSAMSRELSNMKKERILDFAGRKIMLLSNFRGLF